MPTKRPAEEQPLRPDHQRFIERYLVNGNNATEAMAVVKPDWKRSSSAVAASRLLKDAKIQTAIRSTAIKLGLTDKFLLYTLKGQISTEIVSEQVRYDADGKVLERVAWKRSPTPAEVAKVVDTVNKTTGLYELNRATGQALTSQFKELARRYAPKLSRRGAKAISVEHTQDTPDITEYVAYASMTMCELAADETLPDNV